MERGLSYEEAAKLAGIGQGKNLRQLWWQIENADKPTSVNADTLRGMARALQCSMESLMCDDPPADQVQAAAPAKKAKAGQRRKC